MAAKTWKEQFASKCTSTIEALSHIKNGQTIFVGSGAGEPGLLTWALSAMSTRFWDIEILHLTAAQETAKLVRADLQDSFRYNTFYIGRGASAAVAEGRADYTPMNIRELPEVFSNGIIKIDVALIQVSPPDTKGRCSLGVSVDATKAAMECADLVIAQVNEHMPVTCGDSMVSVKDIDFLIEGNAPLVEVPSPKLDPVSLTRRITASGKKNICSSPWAVMTVR